VTKRSKVSGQSPRNSHGSAKHKARDGSHSGASQQQHIETVSGRWLVKALLATLVLAAAALYLTVCLLFYQGQWQFTFLPPRLAAGRKALHREPFSGSWARRIGPAPGSKPQSAEQVAASSGLPITDHHFDTTEEGVNRLDGWWIPGSRQANQQSGNLAEMVVLFCSDGRSDITQNVAAFRALHALGASVFAFDYRGFGASEPGHPSQQKAYDDGVAALRYLTNTRHVDPRRIVVYGTEVGAAVAAHVALQSPQIAGLILENPQPSMAKQVRRQQHIHLLPMWLIFTDRFDISQIIPTLKMPKLVIATPAQPEYEAGADAIFSEAPTPKQIVKINAATPYSQPAWQQAVLQFLNSVSKQSR
jgi:pimeloyl-ACP methyl ester carboxylesterase